MKTKLLLPMALLLFAIGGASAKPVTPDVARRVAQNKLRKTVVDATPDYLTHCYLFLGADGRGFALVAADDCVRPLLGYSADDTFESENLPAHIRAWLDGYQADIASRATQGIDGGPDVADEWQAYANGSKFRTSRDTAVAPLMSTQWDQSPRYNAMCPSSGGESARSVSGCVATATAQIMKYWNHPATGRGSHAYTHNTYGTLSASFDTTHYDWTHMPNRLNYSSSQQEIDAVAQLMYHIGVAVEMDYSPSTSGSHVASYGSLTLPSSENALKDYFRYNQALFAASRDNYTDAQWNDLLTIDLNASRPILFSGSDGTNGHAFVLDGYDSAGFYHVNWGWGGYCDGYYTFDSLSPSGSGTGGNASNSYTQGNHALLHVFPASEASSVVVSVVTSDSNLGSVSGSGTFTSYSPTTLLATASEGHRFLYWKSGNHLNPFTFSPNNDYFDTAVFAPIYGDTLGYCFTGYQSLWGEYGNMPPEWAIRIPASSVPDHRQLNAVQIYGVSNADYTLRVFLGNNFDRQVFQGTVNTDRFGWFTLPLSSPIPLLDSLPIWVVATSRSYSNPAAVSSYSGNPDGTWYKRAGSSWEHLEDRNTYGSWMIRAVLSDLDRVSVIAESSQPERGTVSGSGSYYPGDTAVLSATPAAGYRFVAWSTGESANPLRLRVTAPVTIAASFLPAATEGIDEAGTGADGISVSLDGLTLKVDNPSATLVELYDTDGRLVGSDSRCQSSLLLPAPGVYILRSATSAQKIVAL